MKVFSFPVCAVALALCWGCGQQSHDHAHDEQDHEQETATATSANEALRQEVMKVHDEVMPKMEDIYNLKESLKNKIAAAPDMAAEKKQEIEAMIAQLDSADRGMFDWMHEMHENEWKLDSLGEEQAREFLENEMEKIKKVREDMQRAIEKAKAGV